MIGKFNTSPRTIEDSENNYRILSDGKTHNISIDEYVFSEISEQVSKKINALITFKDKSDQKYKCVLKSLKGLLYQLNKLQDN